jgi:soluble lytic murein transglycosylase-like protein
MFRLFWTLLFIFGCFAVWSYTNKNETINPTESYEPLVKREKSPPCLEMYYSIEKYAEKYKVPKKIAYGIAHTETRYSGPFHWEYDPNLVSYAGAMGPMQVMHSTAKLLWPGRDVTKSMVLNDIDFNVETSMKALSHLYKIYGDWKIVLGCYNTGSPIVNSYSYKVVSFKPNWRN